MADKARQREHALIVGDGEPPSRELLDAVRGEDSLVIAADGGANALAAIGVRPDYIVGDLDSVSPEALAAIEEDRRIRIAAQDSTDLVKALDQALKLGVREAALLGVTGGRVDHTLWNLSLLKMYRGRLTLRILDECCDTRLVDGGVRFEAAPGLKVSLSPLGGPVQGIVTRGLKYPLNGESLAAAERDGISNEVVDNPVEITVRDGDLLLCIQREQGMGDIVLR